MSSLIEQAAQRLEQLRHAGVVPFQAPPQEAEAVPVIPRARLPIERAAESRRIELDLAAMAAASIVTPSTPRSLIADQFRLIKRPLIHNAMGKGSAPPAHANLIMVTSAVAGEGKSFTSINLAVSIAAELDHTVMLVDADVARPSLPGMLGVPDGRGLLDLLNGSAEMADVLLKTNIEKLTLLRSGTPHPRATEMLASEAMRQLLDDMAKRYPDRIIVFDSPPLLFTTEARVLATNMGQIVMVVRAGSTLQTDVEHALSTIESCPVRMMMLNQTQADTEGTSGLGYGYGYGYGYGREKHGA
ncbi:MAG: tyrosine-protein kinase family protein [Variovorax sp.]|nr:tyrosine-protein kinase family protein [Variovorax sp.]